MITEYSQGKLYGTGLMVIFSYLLLLLVICIWICPTYGSSKKAGEILFSFGEKVKCLQFFLGLFLLCSFSCFKSHIESYSSIIQLV